MTALALAACHVYRWAARRVYWFEVRLMLFRYWLRERAMNAEAFAREPRP